MLLPGHASKRVLVTVKTYPNASKRYEETVCTAGIMDEGKWIRLYPLNFRRLPSERQFRKYQWIDIDVESRGNTQDKRPESFRPDLDSVRPGRIIGTGEDGWRERRELLSDLPVRTLKECQAAYDLDKTSLSLVQPSEVLDFVWERNVEEPEWSGDFRRENEQTDLFGQKPLRLERLPYKFSYVFRCPDQAEPIQRAILDWELGPLFFQMREQKETLESALQSVRDKFLGDLCSRERDVSFFMGTIYPMNTWLVLGVFCPPRRNQLELF